MRRLLNTCALISLLLVIGIATPVPAADVKAFPSGVDPSGFDKCVRPQDDFFRYVNGGWIARTKIPGDRSAHGSFFALRDQSESNLRAIIEKAAADGDPSADSEVRKFGDLYISFMDEARADRLGKKPIWRPTTP
jgi:putative endopeptidase